MKHKHNPGCRCANCLCESQERESAAQQLYSLLDMQWIGMRAAKVHADLARKGIDDSFPYHAQDSLHVLRERNPALLDSLLTDILD
jgi:hypothetical protein